MDIAELFSQLMSLIKSLPGLPLPAKIAAVVLFLIALWKSSLLRPFWDKLGATKVLVAPIMSLIVAVVSVQPFSLTAMWQSLLGGAIAIALSEFLQALEAMPWIGEKYKSWLAFVDKLLKKPAPAPQA